MVLPHALRASLQSSDRSLERHTTAAAGVVVPISDTYIDTNYTFFRDSNQTIANAVRNRKPQGRLQLKTSRKSPPGPRRRLGRRSPRTRGVGPGYDLPIRTAARRAGRLPEQEHDRHQHAEADRACRGDARSSHPHGATADARIAVMRGSRLCASSGRIPAAAMPHCAVVHGQRPARARDTIAGSVPPRPT
jgi:hypothetical protein